MKVLFVASEAVPFVKTGGLADVIGALPKRLKELGCDVRIMLPKYADIPAHYRQEMEQRTRTSWTVQLGWREQYCGVQELELDGIVCYFIDNEYYYKRGGLYGYGDEAERFAFMCRAVLEALPRLDFKPDIIHCHDWQTGLIPYLLKNKLADHPFYKGTRTVFTIHNLMYQGIMGEGLLRDLLGIDGWDQSPKQLELHGGVSAMKGGIAYADKVTTVSPTYAEEICTSEYGEYLDGLLRWRKGDLLGIVNGIDNELYDPMTDPHLHVPYRNSLPKKADNKLALQRELGLPEGAGTPMAAMVTRLVEQKGLDLLGHILPQLMESDLQLVVLGTGEEKYERMLREAERRYPGKLRACIYFDEGLARRIYASSDMFLMPSRFEPCGIGQLLAIRYRSVPIVRETGGLKDTVKSYNEYERSGWGFSFSAFNAWDMLYTIRRALHFYQDKEHWNGLHRQLQRLDYGWSRSAKAYVDVYRSLVPSVIE